MKSWRVALDGFLRWSNRDAFLLLLLANFAVCFPSFGATDSATRPSIPSWEMKDRLPVNKVKSMVQTHDGHLWLGTFDGLGRYDGVSLKLFDKASTPALPSNLMACLFEDRAGTLWIGCENGEVVCMVHGRFERAVMPSTWPAASVESIVEDRTGQVWLLNQRDEIVSIRRGQRGQMFALPPLNAQDTALPLALVNDASGTVWVSRGRSLLQLSSDATNAIQLPTKASDPVVFAARKAGLWVVDGDWLRRWEEGKWVEDRGHHSWGEVIRGLPIETSEGEVLIPTSRNELFIIDEQGLEPQPMNGDAPARDCVSSLFEDREGLIWVGMAASGLNNLRLRVATMVEPPDHWLGQPVVTVAPKKQGGLFIGTQSANVYHYDRGLFTGLSRIRDESSPNVRSVCEDADNSLWVGTWGDGLWRGSQGVFERVEPTNEFPRQISAIFQSSIGDMWFGTDNGPVQLHNGKLRYLAREFPIEHADARCFAESADGTIWVGLQGGGLGRFASGQWTQFSRETGLGGDTVWSLYADADGSIWIGTYGAGLCRYKSGKFNSVSSRNGLPSDVICSIVDDQNGHFWISSFAGVFRVSKEALARCADGEPQLEDCHVYGLADGLASLEFSGGGQPGACRTADGRLWFASNKGLAMIEPAAARNISAPPPAAIQDMLIDGEAVDTERLQTSLDSASTPIEVGPGRRHVEIRYAGLSLSAPDHVRFRYRMKGLENDWVEAGNRRSAYYSYLPAGQYTFEVLACNNSGVWSQSAATVKLWMKPYFWQTWWFVGGTAFSGTALVALVATGISRQRERRKRDVMERQRASEMERTRIARDIHDQLGVGLTRISMLSHTVASREAAPAARQNIEEIHRTTADLTRSMDEIVWAVNPQHDTLDSLLMYLAEFARKFLEIADIRCRLDLPIQVPGVPLSAELRHHVFLAFQEGLNNVVKHAQATEVRITAALQSTQLLLCLEDNGRGFIQSGNEVVEGLGNGLKNMTDRLGEVGGRFVCESRPGVGTRIRLIIPIQK